MILSWLAALAVVLVFGVVIRVFGQRAAQRGGDKSRSHGDRR
jgi:hypothetical protein